MRKRRLEDEEKKNRKGRKDGEKMRKRRVEDEEKMKKR